jgi:hypothetical protein
MGGAANFAFRTLASGASAAQTLLGMQARTVRNFAAVLALASSGLVRPVSAGLSPWQKLTEPNAAIAEQRYAQADNKRTSADPYQQGEDHELLLNELCAQALLLSGAEQLGDPGLSYLLADCLSRAPGQYLEQARRAWLAALQKAPAHPRAAVAWLNVAVQSSLLDEPELALAAYENVLSLEWDEGVRADVYRAQAQLYMSQGDLVRALPRFRIAFMESRALEARCLAEWGLAAALDRAYDHPTALAHALSASRARFGAAGRTSVLDLQDAWFLPAEEKHYFRALGLMAEAKQPGIEATLRLRWLQAAHLMWLQYLDLAPKEGRWVPRAREHLKAIRRQLGSDEEELDALQLP